MKRNWWAAVLAALLVACSGEKEAAPVPPPQVEGQTVRFPAGSPQLKSLASVAAESSAEESLRLPGRLVWDEERSVRVFAPLGGRVLRLLAQPGQKVSAGDPLAVIASPDFGQSQAEATRAEADLRVAEKALARARELHPAGIIAEKDLQQAEADHLRAKAERDRTAARTRLYGGGSGVDQDFVLRAPIGGVVVERNANPGQEIRPDQAQPGAPALFVIADPTRLWVRIELPEAALADVRVGTPFVLSGAALGDARPEGRIEWVADSLDPLTRTTLARGTVANPERRLKAEMFVNAELRLAVGDRVRVPATAVLLLGATQFVFVDQGDGRYARRQVVAEEAGFGRMRIHEGLTGGEKVVTDGALLLQQILATGTP